MPEPPACTRMVSPGSSLALSNSMCCTVAKATGAQAASRKLTPSGNGDDEPRRHVDEIAGEAVDVKAHDAGDVFAQIVAALAAGLADAAGQRAIGDDAVADLDARSTSGPTAAISPAASAPTMSGSLRLANAMPRQPQTSM